MDGHGPTAHWRERVVERMLFDSVWGTIERRTPKDGYRAGRPRRTLRELPAVRKLAALGGPVLVVRALFAAGVLVPGWALVIGNVTALPTWATLLGAAVATVPAFLAAVLAADLQCALVREVHNLRVSHARCRDCGMDRAARLQPARRQAGDTR